jgi:soluble lytic murein transglycosylase-like protein
MSCKCVAAIGGLSLWLTTLGAAPHACAETIGPNVKPRCFAASTLCELIAKEAERVELDPALIDAVIKVESNYDPQAAGSAGEVGLMQILPSTAKLLGFNGTKMELADPATNIRLGATYLAEAWKRAGGDLCRALMKYRAGHAEERITPLSVEYCRRARERLAQSSTVIGAKLTNSSPKAVVHTPPIDRHLKGAAFWTAQNARIRAITVDVHARWARIAKGGRT